MSLCWFYILHGRGGTNWINPSIFETKLLAVFLYKTLVTYVKAVFLWNDSVHFINTFMIIFLSLPSLSSSSHWSVCWPRISNFQSTSPLTFLLESWQGESRYGDFGMVEWQHWNNHTLPNFNPTEVVGSGFWVHSLS